MSLRPHALESVPEETTRVARAAFPKGNPYLLLRDTLGTIFQDDDFAALFPLVGQPGLPPWRLALVTIMQFRENLADRQAAEAVRARIDWKYLLGLDLTDAGFDFSALSEFRDRLLAGSAAEHLLDKLLERCRTLGLLKARGQQRTDSTHVLAAIRVLNRGGGWLLPPGCSGRAGGAREPPGVAYYCHPPSDLAAPLRAVHRRRAHPRLPCRL